MPGTHQRAKATCAEQAARAAAQQMPLMPATASAGWPLTILLPPRTKMVTARELGVPSISSMRSRVVPKLISFTLLAYPSLAALSSCASRPETGGERVRRGHISTAGAQGLPRPTLCSAPGSWGRSQGAAAPAMGQPPPPTHPHTLTPLPLHPAAAAGLAAGPHLEARHDAGACGQRQQLQLHAAHPAHRRQVVVHQQVVGLVVKACGGGGGEGDTWVLRM